jgi:hypothetical protein
MRRLLAIALPAVLLLGTSAAAKGVTAARVCGADGCRSIAGADASLLDAGPPTDGPAKREPFVRMEFDVGGGRAQPVRTVFLPRSGLVLADDGTTWMHPTTLAELRRQARRVTPFAASALPAVRAPASHARGPDPAAVRAPTPRVPNPDPAAARAPAPHPPAPAPADAPPLPAPHAGLRARWLALAAALVALAVAATLAHRRRRDRPTGAAGATG